MTVRIPRRPLSLDPLIAEAKRRARQRRLLVALIAVVLIAAPAVLTVELRGQGSVAPIPANLTVLVVGESFESGHGIQFPWNGGRALFHLKCDPASGNVADPAKACAAIADQPSLVTDPKPYATSGPAAGPITVACHSRSGYCPYNGPDYFTITGSVNGKPVHFSGGGVFATDAELIEKLGLAGRYGKPVVPLEPRRHGFVAMGHTRTFAPGVLRPGDLVTCRTNRSYKYPLAVSVPVHRGNPPEGSSGQAGLMAIRIRANGAVLASCFPRDRMPLDKRGRTIDPKNWPPKSLRP